MHLLIATTNPAKQTVLKKSLTPLTDQGISLKTLADLDPIAEPEETGSTIQENAAQKAHHYANHTGLPTLADDGGFEIDALGGEPGVKSNRWLGYKASDQELIDHTLERLNGIPLAQRTAALVLCLCYFNPETGKQESVTTRITGTIAQQPIDHYPPGFPFRALLKIDGYDKYYDQLTEEEHEQVNHRRKACEQIAPLISNDLQ